MKGAVMDDKFVQIFDGIDLAIAQNEAMARVTVSSFERERLNHKNSGLRVARNIVHLVATGGGK